MERVSSDRNYFRNNIKEVYLINVIYLPIKMMQFFKTKIIRKTLILLFALYTL